MEEESGKMRMTRKYKYKAKNPNGNNATGQPLFKGQSVEIVIQKLESAWAIDATDAQAALYAGISPPALSDYLKKHPELAERKQALLNRPFMVALKTIHESIETSADSAWKFMGKRDVRYSDRATPSVIVNVDTISEETKRRLDKYKKL